MKNLRNLALKLRNLFQKRFYNRLMLYNTLIFVVVAYLFAFIASDYALRLDRVKQIQLDRDALNTLCDYYDRKHDEFYNLVLAIYEEQSNYEAISALLQSESDQPYEDEPYIKRDLTNVMHNITIRDSDIETVMIYKNLTNALYVYNDKSRSVEVAGPEYPFFEQLKEKTAGRRIYGTRTIRTGSRTVSVHGIAGTLGIGNIRKPMGNFLITYNVQTMGRLLQAYTGKIKGRFIVATIDGELIFDSDSQYEKGPLPYMDKLLSGKETAVIGSEPCYIQTITRLNRNYIGVHILPEKDVLVNKSDYPFFIFVIFTIMAFVCAFLYFTAGSMISRRVRTLEKAMKSIGSNNLSYRIPLNGRHDEFEEISSRFNDMCDELQATINREYITEIRKKNAELNALQAGINPHFLYNTLEAIRIKAYDDGNRDVAEMIVHLANLYRSIVRDRTFIPIRKEISLCRIYINIFSLRYASRFYYEVDIEPRIFEYGIPKNLLQPIVENYFVYGIRKDCEDNRFVIRGWMREGDICFSFEDNGYGISKSRLEEIRTRLLTLQHKENSGYGLSNVHERIKLVYGEEYGLSVESDEDCMTRVNIRIKAVTCDELENRIGVNRRE